MSRFLGFHFPVPQPASCRWPTCQVNYGIADLALAETLRSRRPEILTTGTLVSPFLGKILTLRRPFLTGPTTQEHSFRRFARSPLYIFGVVRPSDPTMSQPSRGLRSHFLDVDACDFFTLGRLLHPILGHSHGRYQDESIYHQGPPRLLAFRRSQLLAVVPSLSYDRRSHFGV